MGNEKSLEEYLMKNLRDIRIIPYTPADFVGDGITAVLEEDRDKQQMASLCYELTKFASGISRSIEEAFGVSTKLIERFSVWEENGEFGDVDKKVSEYFAAKSYPSFHSHESPPECFPRVDECFFYSEDGKPPIQVQKMYIEDKNELFIKVLQTTRKQKE